jgi:hypothetical protein
MEMKIAAIPLQLGFKVTNSPNFTGTIAFGEASFNMVASLPIFDREFPSIAERRKSV